LSPAPEAIRLGLKLVIRKEQGKRQGMSRKSGMRQIVVAVIAASTLTGGFGFALPAFADDHAVYYGACVKQTGGNKTMCGCLANLAMAADPQLRADMIMSMAEPGKYRATRAPHVPNAGPEMQAWEKFDVDGNKKCGMDI
jgi:glycerol dehydrogenase-like iron-containing ADH family enzyme